MNYPISELSGTDLDFAIARGLHGHQLIADLARDTGKFVWTKKSDSEYFNRFSPSYSWGHAGPLIHQFGISVNDYPSPRWRASFLIPKKHRNEKRDPSHHCFDGATPLEAAMRCLASYFHGEHFFIDDDLI